MSDYFKTIDQFDTCTDVSNVKILSIKDDLVNSIKLNNILSSVSDRICSNKYDGGYMTFIGSCIYSVRELSNKVDKFTIKLSDKFDVYRKDLYDPPYYIDVCIRRYDGGTCNIGISSNMDTNAGTASLSCYPRHEVSADWLSHIKSTGTDIKNGFHYIISNVDLNSELSVQSLVANAYNISVKVWKQPAVNTVVLSLSTLPVSRSYDYLFAILQKPGTVGTTDSARYNNLSTIVPESNINRIQGRVIFDGITNFSNVSTIGMFYGNHKITLIDFPNLTAFSSTDFKNAFVGCTGLLKIRFNNSLLSMNKESLSHTGILSNVQVINVDPGEFI